MAEEIQAEGIHDGGEEAGEEGEGVEDGAARRSIRKPLAIVVAAILVVAVAAGGMSYLVWGGDEDDDDPGAATIDLGGPLVYHELPEFLVDLQTDGRTSHHIKLQIVAELPEDHVLRMTRQEIGVIDAVLTHLRKQSRDDLTGEAAAERLRSDLLAVINGEIAPAQVRTILFKRFLMD